MRCSLLLGVLLGVLLGACADPPHDRPRVATDSARADSVARAQQDSLNRRQPGYVVDSILPVEEELRRFRAVVGPVTSGLANASASRDALVGRFATALERGDTADLQRMLVTSREFAWEVYPESPYTRAPYRQSPALLWSQIENASDKGMGRLVERAAGLSLHYVRSDCPHAVERQGRNRLWTGCTTQHRNAAGAIVPARLFGTIIERGGRFKFLSYANQF